MIRGVGRQIRRFIPHGTTFGGAITGYYLYQQEESPEQMLPIGLAKLCCKLNKLEKEFDLDLLGRIYTAGSQGGSREEQVAIILHEISKYADSKKWNSARLQRVRIENEVDLVRPMRTIKQIEAAPNETDNAVARSVEQAYLAEERIADIFQRILVGPVFSYKNNLDKAEAAYHFDKGPNLVSAIVKRNRGASSGGTTSSTNNENGSTNVSSGTITSAASKPPTRSAFGYENDRVDLTFEDLQNMIVILQGHASSSKHYELLQLLTRKVDEYVGTSLGHKEMKIKDLNLESGNVALTHVSRQSQIEAEKALIEIWDRYSHTGKPKTTTPKHLAPSLSKRMDAASKQSVVESPLSSTAQMFVGLFACVAATGVVAGFLQYSDPVYAAQLQDMLRLRLSAIGEECLRVCSAVTGDLRGMTEPLINGVRWGIRNGDKLILTSVYELRNRMVGLQLRVMECSPNLELTFMRISQVARSGMTMTQESIQEMIRWLQELIDKFKSQRHQPPPDSGAESPVFINMSEIPNGLKNPSQKGF